MEKQNNKFSSRILASRVQTKKVKLPEMIFGYLIGPFCAMLVNGILMSYLTTYYSDVLGFASNGQFLFILMIFSAILVVFSNVTMGLLIDKTKTPQGKARPWILVSGPLTCLAGILIFAVPTGNEILKIVWVAVSYNLFFAFAHAIYMTAHNSMVPLSTRDIKERSILSILAGIVPAGSVGFAQIIFSLVKDFYLDKGTGGMETRWIWVMSAISVIALIGTVLEYYFTRERVTEGNAAVEKAVNSNVLKKGKKVSKKEVKAVLSDRSWWILILFYLIFQFCGTLKNQAMPYYCKYILGGNGVMSILSAVGAIPMAVGALFIWPITKRLGKKNTIILGLSISIVGGLIGWIWSNVLWAVIVGLVIKGIGLIPANYVLLAMFADALENIEWKKNLRCDGFAMSVYSSIMLSMPSLITGLLTFLLHQFDYDAIQNATSASLRGLYINCFYGSEVVGNVLCILILLFFNIEKSIPQKQKEILERQEKEIAQKAI